MSDNLKYYRAQGKAVIDIPEDQIVREIPPLAESTGNPFLDVLIGAAARAKTKEERQRHARNIVNSNEWISF